MMQGGESFRLIVRRGPQPNQVYELSKEIMTVGRDITNDIVINDPEVSRHHMRLTRGSGGYTLEDLGSTNGTFVNGQRLTGARPLRQGELVGLGETVTLSYEVYGVSSANTLPNAGVPSAGVGNMGMPAGNPAPEPRYTPTPNVPPAIQPPPSPYAPPPNSEYGAPASIAPQQQQPPPGYVPFAPQQPPPAQAGSPIRYSAPPTPQLTPSGQPIYPGTPGAPPYAGAPGAPGNPPGAVPGFDSAYDPYAAREDEPRNNTRLIVLGCGGLAVFCCCASALGAFAIDQLCLWDRLPVINQVVAALGLVTTCAA
jgi:predicted component of type VI protein secretion system